MDNCRGNYPGPSKIDKRLKAKFLSSKLRECGTHQTYWMKNTNTSKKRTKMKYIIVFLLFAMLIAGCSQIESPLDSQDAASAPGADAKGEDQPIVINCEPAYLISVSPESGSEITPDTELTFTFSSAPGYFEIESVRRGSWGQRISFYAGRSSVAQLFFTNLRVHGLQPIPDFYEIISEVTEANRNTVKVSILMSQNRKELYKRLGRPAHTGKWEFYISWQHGYMPISYDVVFPEIEAAEPPPNVPFQDILNSPHEFQGKEVTFEAVVSGWDNNRGLGLETGMITRQFYIENDSYLRNRWLHGTYGTFRIGQKYQFSCLISSVTERDDGLITIKTKLIYADGLWVNPPIVVAE